MIFNEDLLTCNIENIYDFPYSKHISSLVKSKSGKMYSICNIRDVELEHIDTLVIGHLKQYNLREKAVEEVTVLIKKALFLGKSVFCFDSFLLSALDDKTSRQIVIPKICESNLPSGTGGRLWNVPIPSVAIVGSGSRQGKFTVMARLNKQFHRLGYNSGMISTEPYGTFFGADFSFPYGFCSSVEIGPEKIPMMLNSYLLDMYKNSRDVALMELQSATISRHYLNVEQNTFIQSSILFGLNPDAHVITIYPDDNIELIDRINTFIYSQTQSLLVGILIYPYTYRYSVGGEIERISSLPQKKHLEMLQQKFKVPVLDMNSAFEDKICQSIISCLQ